MDQMSSRALLLVIYLCLVNLLSLWMFGVDKYKAKKKKWRTPELSLIVSAAAGGALGAFIGMKLFRHKTKHMKFQVLVPLFLFLWTALAVWLLLIKKI